MIEIINMRDVTEKDIRAAISCMQRRRADVYGGDKPFFDLAITALQRLEAQHAER